MQSGTSPIEFVARSALLVAMAVMPGGTLRAADLRPDPQSPLVTDGRRIFAVAGNHQTLLSAEVEGGSWKQFASIGRGEIRGLTVGAGRLFFSDISDASIQSVPLVGEGKPDVLFRGSPFVRPTELAYSGMLLVVDPGARALFRLPAVAGSSSPVRPTAVSLESAIVSESTLITGLEYGEVLIADRESGLLAQLSDLELPSTKYRPIQSRGSSSAPVAWNQQPERPDTVRRKGYPGITAPASIDVVNGILYVVDGKSGDLFLCGVHDARAIRLPNRGRAVTRIVATQEWLVGLEPDSGRLMKWARLVPAELTLLPKAQYQSLLPVLEYLHRRKLLATRTVEVQGTIGDLLNRERMPWPNRETAVPPDPRKQVASFCLLNPKMCNDGLPIEQVPGTKVQLAELYAERYTLATRITLNGSAPLGEVVDRAVVSEQFQHRRTEEFLRQLNGVPADESQLLRDRRDGTYRISQEHVRYVIPIEATELRPGSDYERLVRAVSDTIRIAPLQRVTSSKAAAGAAADHPDDLKCEAARNALKALLAAIDYAPITSTRSVFVGVAEDAFDTGHRDFRSASDPGTVLYDSDHGTGLKAAPAPPGGPDSPGIEPVTWRQYATNDHGTAIASLIAGRSRPYQQGPGFTDALVAMLADTGDLNALGADIALVLDNSAMSIVNLSLTSKKTEAMKLRNVMEESLKTALFVVSAPNTSQTDAVLCRGNEVWYPACHGQIMDNVLVVGGTTLQGDGIYARSPIGADVHLFAPATDYFAAGRENSYVMVEGTSFATALVSAAAAMLAGLDDDLTPVQIKQRLIATADLMGLTPRQPWARRLNVRRAVSNLKQAVIVDSVGQRQLASVTNKNVTLAFKTVTDNVTLQLAVGSLRRLTKLPGASPRFDLVYAVPRTGRPDALMVQTVKPVNTLDVCYLPLDAEGRINGNVVCKDLAETTDYVAAVR